MRTKGSTFLTTKSKTRKRLVNSEHGFRSSVSKISPQIAELVLGKASASIALTYKYLLVDKLHILFFMSLCIFIVFSLFVYFLVVYSFTYNLLAQFFI